MKKFVCLMALIILLLIGCAQTQSVSEVSSPILSNKSNMNSSVSDVIFQNEEYEYKITDQSVILVKYKGNSADVVMPDEIDGYPVKEITGGVFFETEIKTVTLPRNVEIIGAVFGQTFLSELFIPDSVKLMDDEAFYDCPRELVLLYDRNPLVTKYAQKNNILCFKRSEYNPMLTVELVNGKPLNDDKNQGISKEDFNLIKRRNNTNAYLSMFDVYVSNEYITFWENEKLTDETIKTKLTKTAALLYQCGITGFDSADIKNAVSDDLDKTAIFTIYSRSNEEIEDEDEKGSSCVLFADDRKLYANYEIFFGIKPDFSKITGYSQQQKGIWYYPKEFPKIQTEVLSFSGSAEKTEYTLKLRFTPQFGTPAERTFSFKLTEKGTVSGKQYRITLTGIK